MADLTARLLDPETFEATIADMYLFSTDALKLADIARILHQRIATLNAERDKEVEEPRYKQIQAEVASRKQFGRLYDEITALTQQLATAEAEGAAEALRSLANSWHHYSGHVTLPEVYPRPCQIGCTKCFILAEAKLYDDRAAAIREGIEAKGKA